MENRIAINKENLGVAGNQIRRDRIAKVPKVRTVSRKTLSDISNLPMPDKDAKPDSVLINNKEYIDRLQQENTALVRFLADKNKIIEMSAIELQKLRVHCQKVQQQNVQFAQANSQMLAELNAGKDKLKALHHELGCKNALLNARQLQLEENADTVKCQTDVHKVESIICEEAKFDSQVEKGCKKSCDSKRKRCSKGQSLKTNAIKLVQAKKAANQERLSCRMESAKPESEEFKVRETSSPIKVEQVQVVKNVEQKRLCTQRQSAKFTSQEQEQEQEMRLEMDDVKSPVSPADELVNGSSKNLSGCPRKSPSDSINGASGFKAKETRSSIRPMRRAAEKVQSYKEIPINVKMRRPD